MAKRVVLKVDEIQSPLDSSRKAIYYKENANRVPEAGDVLVFNKGNQCFSNEPMSAVGGIATAVISTEMGIDVVSTNSGADTNYKFGAASPNTSGIKISEADDANVSAGGLQDGDHFMWDGTAQKWVNKQSPKVNINNPQSNEVLLYNSSTSEWENKNVTVATGSSMSPLVASMIFG